VVPARPAGEDDFREKTIEVTEMDEEAVVAKQARVIEEVVVRKDVAEVEQTITNTVRRTKVAVENTGTDVASDRMAGTERTRKSSDKA
jgi:stress response protein YsnF